jgi:hypothetical protein
MVKESGMTMQVRLKTPIKIPWSPTVKVPGFPFFLQCVGEVSYMCAPARVLRFFPRANAIRAVRKIDVVLLGSDHGRGSFPCGRLGAVMAGRRRNLFEQASGKNCARRSCQRSRGGWRLGHDRQRQHERAWRGVIAGFAAACSGIAPKCRERHVGWPISVRSATCSIQTIGD